MTASRASPGLLALARLWLSQATGLVRGRTGEPVPIRRGGVVSVASIDALRTLVRDGHLHLHHYPVSGDQDRAAVSRLLVELALRESSGSASGEVLDAQAVAPLAALEALGVRVQTPAPLRVVHDVTAVAAEHLGLMRVKRPSRPAPLGRAPRTDEFVIDLDRAYDRKEAESFEAELARAQAFVETGAYAEAGRLLVRLRDRRMDEPRVLYLLVEARLGAQPNPDHAALGEIKAWLQMANLLGGTGEARSRAELVFDGALRPSPYPN